MFIIKFENILFRVELFCFCFFVKKVNMFKERNEEYGMIKFVDISFNDYFL